MRTESTGRKACSVLVVEDDDDLRQVIVMAIRTMGYDVLGAADGHEAIEALKRERVDIALIDLGLPDMDGEVVARLARELPERPILAAMSGRTNSPLLSVLFDVSVGKPVDFDVLSEVLRPSLEPKEQRP